MIDAAEAAMQSIKGINKSVDQVIVCIAATEALLDDASVESAIELLEKKCGSKEPVIGPADALKIILLRSKACVFVSSSHIVHNFFRISLPF